jgi:hypothetical protein
MVAPSFAPRFPFCLSLFLQPPVFGTSQPHVLSSLLLQITLAVLSFAVAMPGFVKRANGKAGPKAKAKPRQKRDAKARANAFYEDLQVLAEQEEAPTSLTEADIQKILIPSSYKQHAYTMRLWKT